MIFYARYKEMMDRDQKLFSLLFEKGPLCFQEIFDKRIYTNRNMLHKRLVELEKQGLVQEENAHARGRKVLFSLTEEGKDKLIRRSAEELSKAFGTVKRMMDHIAKDPSKIEEWRNKRKTTLQGLRFTEDMSDEEREKILKAYVQTWDRPLTECLRAVHEVILKTDQHPIILQNQPDADYFIMVKKRGDAYIVETLPEPVYLQMRDALEAQAAARAKV